MNEIWLNLIVIAVIGLLVILLFVFLKVRKNQKDAQFTQMAIAKGWKLERIQQPLVSGYQISGKFPTATWVLETLAIASDRDSGPGSSSISHTTRWWTESIQLDDRAIAIGPLTNPGDAQILTSFNGPFLQMALRKMLGEDDQWAASLSPVEAGSAAFKKQFLCLSTHKRDVEKILQPEVEKLLLTLAQKYKPVIKLHATGLEISVPTEQIVDQTSLELIVNLGKALVRSWEGGD